MSSEPENAATSSPSLEEKKAKFAGKWVLDEKLSESSEEILAAQGIGWAKRKLMNFLSVTQDIVIRPDEIDIEFITKLKQRKETMKLDGSKATKPHDEFGQVEVSCYWSEKDGELTLVLVMEADHPGTGHGKTTLERKIIDEGKRMIQVMSFQSDDGKLNISGVKRYFNKM